MDTVGLTAGKETDAKCTKCKRVTGHTIVIMKDEIPGRVKCNTCGSEHKYKAPPVDEEPAVDSHTVVIKDKAGRKKAVRVEVEEIPEKAPKKKAPAKKKAAAKKKAPARTRKKKPPPTHQEVYAILVEDMELGEPIKFKISHTFQVDDLVLHKTLGLGLVTGVRSLKIDVHFQELGPKTLIHGQE